MCFWCFFLLSAFVILRFSSNPFEWNDLKWQSRSAMIHFMMFLSHIYRFGAFFHSLMVFLQMCVAAAASFFSLLRSIYLLADDCVPKTHFRIYLHVKTFFPMIDACFIGLSVCFFCLRVHAKTYFEIYLYARRIVLVSVSVLTENSACMPNTFISSGFLGHVPLQYIDKE